MDIVETFVKEEYPKYTETEKETYMLVDKFQKDYPRDKISDMKLEDYLFFPGRMNESFCERLFNEMNCIASRGNNPPDVFGVYGDKNYKIKIYKADQNFNDDYKKHFELIKKRIVEILDAAEKDDYKRIENRKPKEYDLNNYFKYKLLIVYFPKKFIPVTTKTTIDDYFRRLGLENKRSEDMIYKHVRLKKWKDSMPVISEWSNYEFMRFCVWLQHNNTVLEQSAFSELKNL